MKFGFVKNIIGAVAPTIGTALGGPMGNMAANMVAEALGCEPTPKKIEQAVQAATPEQLAELKKIDAEFEVQMKELEVDLYALQTKDIQDARARFSKDWTSKLIGVLDIQTYRCISCWWIHGIYLSNHAPTSRAEQRSVDQLSSRLSWRSCKCYYIFLLWSF